MTETVRAVEPLQEPPDIELEVPGSKSQTNRAILCAALATGRSELNGALFADDTEAMMSAVEGIGAHVERFPERSLVIVDGNVESSGYDTAIGRPPTKLDVAQSGTSGRFLLPVLATVPGRFVLDGDQQLRSRPFGPQLDALRSLGASIDGSGLPLSITGGALRGGELSIDGGVSSQFLSGLLLAAPRLTESILLRVADALVSTPYVALTIETMAAFGVTVERPGSQSEDIGPEFVIRPTPYRPASIRLEPDASAASYFFAAAAVTGGRIRVAGLGLKTIQGDLAFVRLLEKMGAEVHLGPDWTEVRGPEQLTGITADMAELSDTAQTLAVVATFADSPTEITGIGFIRNKETDRIAAVETELKRRGIRVESTGDGWIVHPGTPNPGRISTYDDHRMAMSFAVLGLVHPGIEIENPGCVSKTFPRFFDEFDRLRS